MHGTKTMSHSTIKEVYGLETVNLRNEDRWYFLNTLFSVSEANLYLQVTTLFDPIGPTFFSSLSTFLMGAKLIITKLCLMAIFMALFLKPCFAHMSRAC